MIRRVLDRLSRIPDDLVFVVTDHEQATALPIPAPALDLTSRHYGLESVAPDPDRWDKIHPQFKAARSYLSPDTSNPSEPQGKAADPGEAERQLQEDLDDHLGQRMADLKTEGET